MCEALDRIENRGINTGMNNAFSLVKNLMDENRLDDLKRATEDANYRNKLLSEMTPAHK